MAKHVVIIGNGITGVTAACFIRKLSDHHLTIISNESDHFFSRTALMYIYMGHMTYEDTKPYEDWFWEKNRIRLLRDYIQSIDPAAKQLRLSSGIRMTYDVLVLATGSKYNRFDWPGQDLMGVQGLYGLQDLALMEENTRAVRRAVVVGGGLIGIEMTEMLRARHLPVTFLVREASYMDYLLPAEESAMVSRHIKEHHVDLRLGTGLKAILPDERGAARAVVTHDGEEIPCQFVGLTAGVHPNLDVVQSSTIEASRGILVNAYFETNVPDVYAAGDCAEFREALPGRQKIEQLWYTGRMHGQTLAHTICGTPTPYQPGVFFNSAKFFDIEYQTYGVVTPHLKAGERTLYWEHPEGRRSIRINYHSDGAVIAFNLMGVRYRQDVCTRWIAERRHVRFVLENLGTANFDPEFFEQYERALVAQYNEQNPGQAIRLKRKRGLLAGILG